MLGIRPGSSERAVNVLTFRAKSPAPRLFLKINEKKASSSIHHTNSKQKTKTKKTKTVFYAQLNGTKKKAIVDLFTSTFICKSLILLMHTYSITFHTLGGFEIWYGPSKYFPPENFFSLPDKAFNRTHFL